MGDKPFLVAIAVDLESTGRKIISMGVAAKAPDWALSKLGWTELTQQYRFPGIIMPEDELGPVTKERLHDYGPILKYNDWDRRTWEWWTNAKKIDERMLMIATLRGELDDSIPPSDVAEEFCRKQWMRIRTYIDGLCTKIMAAGGKPRIVSDNCGFDIGLINSHFRKYIDDRDSIGMHYIPKSAIDSRRVYQSIETPPTWQRKRKILQFGTASHQPVSGREHSAAYDAMRIACDYMGYIAAYPDHEEEAVVTLPEPRDHC